MTWERQVDLYIDTAKVGGEMPLLAIDGTSVSDGTSPYWVQGDHFSLRLFFRTRSDGEATAIDMPATAVMVLAARKQSTIHTSPLLFSADSFALEGTGDDACWVADLDLHTTNLTNAIGSDREITVRIDIEVQNVGNTRRLTYQFDAIIRHQSYAGEGSPDPAEPEYPAPGSLVVKYCDTEDIASGVDDHTVTGLALDFTPAQVLVTVRKPAAAGSNIFATVRDDSISDDGFIVDLSATTPGAGYKLDYLIIEAAS